MARVAALGLEVTAADSREALPHRCRGDERGAEPRAARWRLAMERTSLFSRVGVQSSSRRSVESVPFAVLGCC